jgi:hypothetical protein
LETATVGVVGCGLVVFGAVVFFDVVVFFCVFCVESVSLSPFEFVMTSGTDLGVLAVCFAADVVADVVDALLAEAGGAKGSCALALDFWRGVTALSLVATSFSADVGSWPGAAAGGASVADGEPAGADFMKSTGAAIAMRSAASGIGHMRRRTTSSTRLRSIMTLPGLRPRELRAP